MADDEKADTLSEKDFRNDEMETHIIENTLTEVTIVNSDGTVEVKSSVTTPKDHLSDTGSFVDDDSSKFEKLSPGKISSEVCRSDSNASSTASSGMKKKKPLSPSMQRLTAKKGFSHTASAYNISDDERKAKAENARKKKIMDSHKKDEEKRAAVLERKKKIEKEEMLRKEALFKKLTDTSNQETKPLMKKRISLSTSNISQLKKTKILEKEIKLDDKPCSKDEKVLLRPKSSLSRAKPSSSTGNLLKVKDKKIPDTSKNDFKRPGTAEPKKTISKPPSTRLSLNPRPATALGLSSSERRKTTQPAKPSVKETLQSASTMKKTTSTSRPIKTSSVKKATSIKTDVGKGTKHGTETVPISKTVSVKSPVDKSKVGNTAITNKPKASSTAKKIEIKPTTENSTTDGRNSVVTKTGFQPLNKKTISKSTPPKTSAPLNKPTKVTAAKSTTPKTKSNIDAKTMSKPNKPKSKAKSELDEPKTGNLTEEEAKKALAERRRQAKEEAEAKAKEEREKDEVERIKREEEEKRLAEQLKKEEEQQALLLEQLKKQEEERKVRIQEEKEQREREEKERQEEEQRQREEEIERKAKIELEKRQKEQEKKDQELDAERIERKKRVEMIMARVSAKRNASGTSENFERDHSPDAQDKSLEEMVNGDEARLKVDGILRARGLGRSTENLLDDNKLEVKANSEGFNQEKVTYSRMGQELNSSNDSSNQVLSGDQKLVNEEVIEDKTVPEAESSPPDVLIGSGDAISDGREKLVPDDTSIFEQQITEKYTNILTQSGDSSKLNNVNVESPSMETGSAVQAVNADVSVVHIQKPLNDIETSIVKSSLDITAVAVENVESASVTFEIEKTLLETIDIPNKDDTPRFDSIHQAEEAWTENKTIGSKHNTTTEVSNTKLTIVNTQDTSRDPGIPNDAVIPEISNNNLILITDDSSDVVDGLSSTNEKEQWNLFEEKMIQIQPELQESSNDENKLWKVMEGNVDISECF